MAQLRVRLHKIGDHEVVSHQALDALRNRRTLVEVDGDRHDAVIRQAVIEEGWIEVEIELDDHVVDDLAWMDPGEGSNYSMRIGSSPLSWERGVHTLFRVTPNTATEAVPVFSRPPAAVTPNCPLCGSAGLMIGSVQAACRDDACAMFIWDVTKTRAEMDLGSNSLDPESESP